MPRSGRLAAYATIAALTVAAPAAAGSTYYVSPSGDDAAAGTSVATAWRTPARVNAADLAPGDHVLFQGGARFTGGVRLDAADAGTEADPVVVGAHGSGRPTLVAGSGEGVFALDAGGLVIRDLRLEGPGMDAGETDGLTIFASGPPGARFPRVRVERVEATGFGRWGVVVGSWAGLAGFDGVEIVDTDAHGNALGGIFTYAEQRAVHTSVSVLRSRAWGNPGRPGLARNSGNGIVLGGVDGGLIEGSVAHDNGGRDTAHEGGVGIWAYDSRGVVIQGNESYENRTGGVADGGGFDLDDGVSGSVLQYNHSHDNDGAGLLVANPSGGPVHAQNVVRFNLSERDGRRNGYPGIYVWRPTAGLSVHHNTVVGPRAAVRATGLGDGSAALRNNVLVRTAPGPVVSVAADATAARFQGNAYWPESGRSAIDWAGTSYDGLAAWRAATGQERDGSIETGLEAEPELVGAAAGDGPPAYVPRPGSPLVDAALDLTPFGLDLGPHDLLGSPVPLRARPDIGALEAPPTDRDEGSAAPGAVPERHDPAVAAAGAAAPVGRSRPPRPPALARAAASPRLRIVRAARHGRRLRVVGRAAATLPPAARVRVRVRMRGLAGRSVSALVRGGRFRAVAALPRRYGGGRIEVRYAGDAAHRAQRRSFGLARLLRRRT